MPTQAEQLATLNGTSGTGSTDAYFGANPKSVNFGVAKYAQQNQTASGSAAPKTASVQQAVNSNPTQVQLIFPTELGKDKENNLGHCIVFEPCKLKSSTLDYTVSLQTSSKTATITGLTTSPDVAIQTAASPTDTNSSLYSSQYSQLWTKTGEQIFLPMPESLQTAYNSQWEDADVGAAARGADFWNSLKDRSDAGKSDVGRQAKQSASMAGLEGIKSVFGVDIADAYSLSNGAIINPYSEVLFKGTDHREFEFEFDLTPLNLDEALTLKSIINRFKYHMAPEFQTATGSNNAILSYPSVFDIVFLTLNDTDVAAKNQWLWKIQTCCLTAVVVNATPNGEYAVTKGGSMQSTSLTLKFKELAILTKQNFTDLQDDY
jgi:hypothetical protein